MEEIVDLKKKPKFTLKKVLIYLLVLILFLFLLFGIYFLTHFKIIEKSEFENRYVFSDNRLYENLPITIQNKYILKNKCPSKDSKCKLLKNKVLKLNNDLKLLKEQDTIVINKQWEDLVALKNKCDSKVTILKEPEYKLLEEKITKLNEKLKLQKEKSSIIINEQKTKLLSLKNNVPKTITKIKEICSSTNSKKIENFTLAQFSQDEYMKYKINDTSKYSEHIMCADMPKDKVFISKICLNKIKNFVNKHKNAKYYEVVAVLDIDEKYSDMKKLVLAHKRSSEIIWKVRKELKFKLKVFPVTFISTSKKHSRGAVIRVYD